MKNRFFLLFFFLLYISPSIILFAKERDEELRDEMWNSSDKDFKVVNVPEKWMAKSAVIIAQLHRFEYRKAVMANLLRINEYSHYRIKLIDKNAVNKYAEITYLADQPGAAASTGLKVYVGFKVIKPNGKEIIVSVSSAVRMEREGSSGKIAYNKIAIPNLDPGDILDYYICEENSVFRTAHVQFFDPVIYNLPQEYPVVKQKLQFKVERKCYINLRCSNGAPELKLVVDEENDETYYSLEDGDRDGIADVRWLYPNRALPTIKFRAAYASNAGMRLYDVLLGEQGEVKGKVNAQELVSLTATLMNSTYTIISPATYLKEKYKGVKDPGVLSKASYYYCRNQILSEAEIGTLNGSGLSSYNEIHFVNMFSGVLRSKKIPHDIVIGVNRNISALDEIVIENELEYFVRVKSGDDYIYFSPLDIYITPGTIYPRLEGTEAYVIDGLVSASKRIAKRVTIPTSKAEDNYTETSLVLKTTDLTSATISATHILKGVNKLYAQYEFLDVYDAINEDDTKFKPYESFSRFDRPTKKKYVALKEAYIASRDKTRNESFKKSIGNDYDFKVKELSNFKIVQTGRYDDKPDMIYTFDFVAEDLIKKTGPNYLVDIGKLIEGQVKIEGDEMERNHGIYFDNARSYRYKVIFEIPNGYEVQGLDKLNQKVENATGGFVSTAKQEDGKLIIETYKHYDKLVLPKEQWTSVVSFLNAAHTFTEQKILLKKVAK